MAGTAGIAGTAAMPDLRMAEWQNGRLAEWQNGRRQNEEWHVSKLRSTMPPKGSGKTDGKGSVAFPPTHFAKVAAAKRNAAAESSKIAKPPTCTFPQCGVKTVANARIHAEAYPDTHAPLASDQSLPKERVTKKAKSSADVERVFVCELKKSQPKGEKGKQR
jgi:hypothetical protein